MLVTLTSITCRSGLEPRRLATLIPQTPILRPRPRCTTAPWPNVSAASRISRTAVRMQRRSPLWWLVTTRILSDLRSRSTCPVRCCGLFAFSVFLQQLDGTVCFVAEWRRLESRQKTKWSVSGSCWACVTTSHSLSVGAHALGAEGGQKWVATDFRTNIKLVNISHKQIILKWILRQWRSSEDHCQYVSRLFSKLLWCNLQCLFCLLLLYRSVGLFRIQVHPIWANQRSAAISVTACSRE